jgi:hypothetical protein
MFPLAKVAQEAMTDQLRRVGQSSRQIDSYRNNVWSLELDRRGHMTKSFQVFRRFRQVGGVAFQVRGDSERHLLEITNDGSKLIVDGTEAVDLRSEKKYIAVAADGSAREL